MKKARSRTLALTVSLGLAVLGALAAQGVGAQGVAAQKVTMVESWFIHAESIGDPVAVAKGFYKPLDVTVVPGGPGLSPIERVLAESKAGRIAFGVDYPQNLLEARVKQKLPLVMVAVDFQESAMRILSWKPIARIDAVKGNFAAWIGYDKPIKAAVGKGWDSKITMVNQQGDPASLGGWLAHQYDYASAMIYNEVMVAKTVAKDKYYTYSYKDFGVDWPENVLFTTEDVLAKYPEVVRQFVEARYKGFKYALDHPAEAGAILGKANPNLDIPFELKGLAQIKTVMATADTRKNGLGYVNTAKLTRMAQQLTAAGVFDSLPSLAGFVKAVPSKVMP